MDEAQHKTQFSVLDDAQTAIMVFNVNLDANSIGKPDITPTPSALGGDHLAKEPEVFEDIRTKSWITHKTWMTERSLISATCRFLKSR
jgi:hypothetical protein